MTLICFPDCRQHGRALLHGLPGEQVARILGRYGEYVRRNCPPRPTARTRPAI